MNSGVGSTVPIHLSNEELTLVRQILARHLAGFEIWAFGSRVHGRHLKPFSDLDLAVVGREEVPPERITAARMAFAESDLPFRVDLIEARHVDPGFRERIEREHLLLQSPSAI